MSRLYRLFSRLMGPFRLLQCGATLGVRAIVVRPDGQVLLVRHTYISGWYLPGGGVERGENFGQALARELIEETNIELSGPAELVGLYHNPRFSKRDYVGLYLCRSWRQKGPLVSNAEIAECRFSRLMNFRQKRPEARKPDWLKFCKVAIIPAALGFESFGIPKSVKI